MRVRRLGSLIAAAGLAVALVGCSDKGEDPEPAPSPSAGSTSPGGTGSEATSEPSASSESSASVAPATGQLVTLESTVTFRLPDGVEWGVYDDKTSAVVIDTVDIPEGADDFVHIDATEFPQITDDLAQMAKGARTRQQERHKIPLELTGYRTIGGVSGFVLEGTGDKGQFYEWGGLDANNVLTTLVFIVPAGLDVAEWVEPVLASVQWQ